MPSTFEVQIVCVHVMQLSMKIAATLKYEGDWTHTDIWLQYVILYCIHTPISETHVWVQSTYIASSDAFYPRGVQMGCQGVCVCKHVNLCIYVKCVYVHVWVHGVCACVWCICAWVIRIKITISDLNQTLFIYHDWLSTFALDLYPINNWFIRNG